MPAQRLLLLSILLVVVGCAANVPPALQPASVSALEGGEIVAVAWSASGERVLAAFREGDRCALAAVQAAGGAPSPVAELDFCPDSMRPLPDGSLIVSSRGRVVLLSATGERLGEVLDALDRDRRLVRESGSLVWPGGARTAAPGGDRFRLLPGGAAALAVQRGPDGERLVRLSDRGDAHPVAGPFPEIDSFDVAPDGSEAVFSARRESFDVALVSTEGSAVHWVGPDPLDERMVSWAPRGSKITYRIEGPMGVVLRSVHVPTGFQLSFSWAGTSVRALSWQPAAEKFVVLAESPSLSPHARVSDYAGKGWSTVLGGTEAALLDPEPAGALPDAWVRPPERLRYDERVPLIVWLEGSEPIWAWNRARAALQKNLRVGLAVLGPGAERENWLGTLVQDLPWVDPQRVYIVARRTAGTPGLQPGLVISQEGVTVPTRGDVARFAKGASDSEVAALLTSRVEEAENRE